MLELLDKHWQTGGISLHTVLQATKGRAPSQPPTSFDIATQLAHTQLLLSAIDERLAIPVKPVHPKACLTKTSEDMHHTGNRSFKAAHGGKARSPLPLMAEAVQAAVQLLLAGGNPGLDTAEDVKV